MTDVTLTREQLKEMMETAVSAALNAFNIQPHDDVVERTKIKAAERPEIDIGCNENHWAFFLEEWKSYKRRTSLKPTQIVDELRACCTKELRKTLFDFVGGTTLENITETDLLEKMKASAVIGKSVSVHRKEFYSISQSPGENINLFVAKLKSKAEHCNFTISCVNGTCTQANSYAEAMVSDQMIVGLYDKDIQQEVLARDKELRTFSDRYALIEAQELGRLAKCQLNNSSTANIIRSQYKRLQSVNGGSRNTKVTTRCPGCNSEGHAASDREKKCPAWGKKCFNCGKQNHFGRCCLQKQRHGTKMESTINVSQSGEQPPAECSTSYFFTFSVDIVNHFHEDQAYSIPHIEWNGTEFVTEAPQQLPALWVKIRPMPKSYNEVSNEVPITHHHAVTTYVTVKAFTDTCTQTCVSGVEI